MSNYNFIGSIDIVSFGPQSAKRRHQIRERFEKKIGEKAKIDSSQQFSAFRLTGNSLPGEG
jgi:hypothetical protein